MSREESRKGAGASGEGCGSSDEADTFKVAGLDVTADGNDLIFVCKRHDHGDDGPEVCIRDTEDRVIFICKCVNGVWSCKNNH